MYQEELKRIQKKQKCLLQVHNLKKEQIKPVLDWVMNVEKGNYSDQKKQSLYKALASKKTEYAQILNYLSLENKKLHLQKLIEMKRLRPKVPTFADNDPSWNILSESEKSDCSSEIKQSEDFGFEEFNYSDNTTASSEEKIQEFQPQKIFQQEETRVIPNNKQIQKRFESFETAINKVFESLNIKDDQIIQKSLEICAQIVSNQNLIKGKQSHIIAGAIIHLSSLILIKPIHHRKIASAVDCKEKTLLQICDQIRASGISQDKDLFEIQTEYILNKFSQVYTDADREYLKRESIQFFQNLSQLVDGEQKTTLATFSVFKVLQRHIQINIKQIAELGDMCDISLKNLESKVNKKYQSFMEQQSQQQMTEVY